MPQMSPVNWEMIYLICAWLMITVGLKGFFISKSNPLIKKETNSMKELNLWW